MTAEKIEEEAMSEITRRGRGRPKVMSEEVQRACIVDCAKKLFLKKGYGSTTTDEIATVCRISKQTLYGMFAGKAALFAAVIEAYHENLLELPGQYDDLPLDEALERIFKIDTEGEVDRERVGLLRLLVTESPKYPEIGIITRQHGYEKAQGDLAAWLADQRRRGLISIDDVDSAARMLSDMVFSPIILKAIGDPQWPNPQKRQAHTRRCISVFLNGVRPRSDIHGEFLTKHSKKKDR
jgi:TetR/AcrR family transcriptional regulator, mexJK operon transcriptional repressor